MIRACDEKRRTHTEKSADGLKKEDTTTGNKSRRVPTRHQPYNDESRLGDGWGDMEKDNQL